MTDIESSGQKLRLLCDKSGVVLDFPIMDFDNYAEGVTTTESWGIPPDYKVMMTIESNTLHITYISLADLQLADKLNADQFATYFKQTKVSLPQF